LGLAAARQGLQNQDLSSAEKEFWMPHRFRSMFTPARLAANVTLLGLLGSLVAIAPIGALTQSASAATGTITEYRPSSGTCYIVGSACLVQTTSSDPLGITSAAGKLWYTDAGEDLSGPNTPQPPGGQPAPRDQIGSMNPDGSGFQTSQIDIPGAVSVAIAPDANGNLWVANNATTINDIVEVDPATGAAVPPPGGYGLGPTAGTTGTVTSAQPTDIVAGPDGNMWFTEFATGRIGTIGTGAAGTTLGALNYYVLSGGQAFNAGTPSPVTSNPIAIISGPGGKMWATVQFSQNIAMITPGTATPAEDHVGLPGLAGITTGSDGNVWFTAEGGFTTSTVQPDRPTPQGNGALAMLPANAGTTTVPTLFYPPSDGANGINSNFAPNAIVSGPDGNLYMTDIEGNAIWQFNPVSHAWNKFAVPTANAFSGNVEPTGITVGPDRNIWFTENNANLSGATQQPAALAKLEVDSTVSFSPAPVQFGTQAVNQAATKAVNVSNASVSPIAVSSSTISGDPAFTITGTNSCAASIPAGANTCSVQIQFKPTTSGSKTATLVLADGQGASGTDSVVLTGVGAGAPALTPANYTFPDQSVGSASKAATFSLGNISGAPLPVTGASIGGTNASDFTVTSNGCTGTIGDQSSCAVQVSFVPKALGTRTATLTIAYNGGSQSATLTGRGIAAVAGSNPGNGYWLGASDGGIFNYGSATFHGSAGSIKLNQPIVGMARTPDGGGYWLVATDGGIFNYGDAKFYGSAGSIHLNKPIVGMAATPDGGGYWLVASDGGIFNYGDAKFYGSAGSIHLNKPIVGMTASPTGLGYWLVATDGGIFNYGDAKFFGSAGSIVLNKPIVGMAATATGAGYWLVATDGGIFNYGDATFHGSAGAIHLNKPIVGMAPTLDGQGYWLVATDGGIFNYGDAKFFGSAGSITLNKPIVGMAASS
jgi:streptogramin lyase